MEVVSSSRPMFFFKGNMLQKPKIGRRNHAFLVDFPLNRSTTGYLVGCRKWAEHPLFTSLIFPLKPSIDGGIFMDFPDTRRSGVSNLVFQPGDEQNLQPETVKRPLRKCECFWVQDCRFIASFSMGWSLNHIVTTDSIICWLIFWYSRDLPVAATIF